MVLVKLKSSLWSTLPASTLRRLARDDREILDLARQLLAVLIKPLLVAIRA
nr:hypothetical protein CDS [Bradyrhizobium sp.]